MHDARALRAFLDTRRALAVLTGAGVSTGSGIPDYRDRNGEPKVRTPIHLPEFVTSEATRRRYWARSFVGWQRFSAAHPNAAHRALAELESQGRLTALVTQNVDGLHQQAGSSEVIELHGNLAGIACLQCGRRTTRADHQLRLRAANDAWHARVFEFRPDGDAELAEEDLGNFTVPGCATCGGIVKPDVVMFGENVPRGRVAAAAAAVGASDALLIVGSSLMVYSGLRFARQAADAKIPIAIVNDGRTRADDLATLKIEADCTVVLPALLR